MNIIDFMEDPQYVKARLEFFIQEKKDNEKKQDELEDYAWKHALEKKLVHKTGLLNQRKYDLNHSIRMLVELSGMTIQKHSYYGVDLNCSLMLNDMSLFFILFERQMRQLKFLKDL